MSIYSVLIIKRTEKNQVLFLEVWVVEDQDPIPNPHVVFKGNLVGHT